jgi:hypothetical protein
MFWAIFNQWACRELLNALNPDRNQGQVNRGELFGGIVVVVSAYYESSTQQHLWDLAEFCYSSRPASAASQSFEKTDAHRRKG